MISVLTDQLELITQTTTKDEYGIERSTRDFRKIFCDAASIGANEYYTAAQTGLRPALRFIVLFKEYAGETQLRYNSEILSVYRTYQRSLDYIELYTERRQGENGQGHS